MLNFYKQKLLPFCKKNMYSLIVSIIAIFVVFIMPKLVFSSDPLTILNHILLLLLLIQWIVFLIYKKKKNSNGMKSDDYTKIINVGGSVVAIVFGLFIGIIVMLIVNPSQVGDGILTILKGGFNNGFSSLGNMIYYSVPIILSGLSVAFAFRTGLFNIGATGQITVGAFFAVLVGVKGGAIGEVSPFLHWFFAVLAGAIAGGVWGAIPGLLKAYRNVNEVVSSIMLNYIGMYFVTIMIKKYIYNVTYARALDIQPTAVTPTWNLEYLFPNSSVNIGILVAIVVAMILHIVLNKTAFGYELKAVGFNRDASRFAGINEKRNIVLSMVISGAVAGIAGAMIFLIQGKNMKPENSMLQEGFTGIAISLLGLNSPIGTVLAGLFYGYLYQGGYYLQLLNFSDTIIDIIIAVIIYASALSLFIQKYLLKWIKWFQRKKTLQQKQGGDNQ